MRNISPELKTHLEGEVTSVCDCIEIERTDGGFVRLTTHDKNLNIAGDIYYSGASFNPSAIKSSSDLSVDNLDVDISIDETLIRRVDFNNDLYRRAKFVIFSVNWDDLTQGKVILKRGYVGDITIRDADFATLALRGLTQALQKPFLKSYSPTCRAQFGDAQCGVAIAPSSSRRQLFNYKIGDHILVADEANKLFAPLTNLSFDVGTLVDWQETNVGVWSVSNDLPAFAGGFYAVNSGAGALVRSFSTSSVGLSSTSVDAGDYTYVASVFAASATAGRVRVGIETYNNANELLRRQFGAWETTTNDWSEYITSIYLPPTTRRIVFYVEAEGAVIRVDSATLYGIILDNNTYNGVSYKSVRIPTYARTERNVFPNPLFADDGIVTNGTSGISSWDYSIDAWWRVTDVQSGIRAPGAGFFLAGGDNSSGLPDQEYSLSQTGLITVSDIMELKISYITFDTVSRVKIKLEALDNANVVLATKESAYVFTQTPVWTTLSVAVKTTVAATKVRVTLTAKSGTTSNANIGISDVEVYTMSTDVPDKYDARRGLSSIGSPVFDTTLGMFTYDDQIIWQTNPIHFFVDNIATITDRRIFTVNNLVGAETDFYGAKITWLTGQNVGITSFVRTWSPLSKELRLYSPLPKLLTINDKFVITKGCNKTVNECAARFDNAINFRGEPYLPGAQKIIDAFTIRNV